VKVKAMPTKKKSVFDPVRTIGLALPDVEESTMYGGEALKVRGRMFACRATHSSAEPDTLVVLIDFDRRDELIAAEPDTYYLKDHYVNYACVLVRLRRIRRDALADLLLMAHRFVSSKQKKRAPPTRRAARSI
jgi:hypothetical protein